MTSTAREILALLDGPHRLDRQRPKRGGVPHDHTTFMDWCFRCHLSRDEEEDVD